MDYRITLTEAENKALEFICADVQEWIDYTIHNRSRIAIDEICRIYTEYKLNNDEPITVVGKPAMVLAAFQEGLIKTGAERVEDHIKNN
jgi:hypothetical protein